MHVERIEGDGNIEYLVWDSNYTRVIATARIGDCRDGYKLEVINVVRDFRGNGIGTKLLKRIASDFSGSELSAWVFKHRMEWYERNGFKVVRGNGNFVRLKLGG